MIDTISCMPSPSTDIQSVSSFASLNRADQTHQRKELSLARERMAGFVIAGLIAVLAISLVVGTW